MDLFSHTLCEEVSRLKKDYLTNTNTLVPVLSDNEIKSSSKSHSQLRPTPPNQQNIVNIESNNNIMNSNDTIGISSNENSETVTSVTKNTTISSSSIINPDPSTLPNCDSDMTCIYESKHFIKSIISYLISMIEIISRIHDAGIVHRDIKPENFMFSVVGEEKKMNIIDFGLSKFYMKSNTHVENTHNRSIVGTIRYISLNVHEGDVYSRRDDIISIMYVIIYLIKGKLPWMGLVAKKGDNRTKEELVYEVKLKVTTAELCEGIPYLFKKLIDYSYTLEFDEKPDYSYMIRQCKNLIKIL